MKDMEMIEAFEDRISSVIDSNGRESRKLKRSDKVVYAPERKSVCEVCGDVGFIVNGSFARKCPGYGNKPCAYMLKQNGRSRVRLIPAEFKGVTLKGLRCPEGHADKKGYNEALKLMRLSVNDGCNPLTLIGSSGAGKSHICAAWLREVASVRGYGDAIWLSFPEIVEKVSTDRSYLKALGRILSTYKYVVVDEFGASNSQWVGDISRSIAYKRMSAASNGFLTSFNTNYDPATLAKIVGTPVFDRMRSIAPIHVIGGTVNNSLRLSE